MKRRPSDLFTVSLTKDNFDEVMKRVRGSNPLSDEVFERARGIIEDVRRRGDRALIDYTRRFDGLDLSPKEISISKEELERAPSLVSQEQIRCLRLAKGRIERTERTFLQKVKARVDEQGVSVRRVARALESVGCYVPGGGASYVSTLLMTVVPAKVAGVRRVVVCSPSGRGKEIDPLMLATAGICGVDEFFRVGGAQAIAALAYGTETIRPVSKIVGPGNPYVTAAKLLASKDVPIDLPAGPSEILVVADESAKPELIAWDMIAQAEHGRDSLCGAIVASEELAEEVLKKLVRLGREEEGLERAVKAVMARGFILVCEDRSLTLEFAEAFAPEHLEVMIEDAEGFAEGVSSAGLVLLGPYTPAAASDYCLGTNHVLPTGGFGRSYSGLSSLDFVRFMEVAKCTKRGLERLRDVVGVMAEAEGLPLHRLSVEERFRGGG